MNSTHFAGDREVSQLGPNRSVGHILQAEDCDAPITDCDAPITGEDRNLLHGLSNLDLRRVISRRSFLILSENVIDNYYVSNVNWKLLPS